MVVISDKSARVIAKLLVVDGGTFESTGREWSTRVPFSALLQGRNEDNFLEERNF